MSGSSLDAEYGPDLDYVLPIDHVVTSCNFTTLSDFVCISVCPWYTGLVYRPSLKAVGYHTAGGDHGIDLHVHCPTQAELRCDRRGSQVRCRSEEQLRLEGISMYRRILAALDGSALAEQALSTAITLAEQLDSELFLLRVVIPLPISYRAGAASAAVIEAAERDAVLEAADYLDVVAEGIREKGFAVQVATRLGNPSKAIVEFVERNQIDLLVMCTRGQTGPTRWLLGSVTDHVVRGSSIPVVVVPARTEDLHQ